MLEDFVTGDDTFGIAEYYVTCAGENILIESIESANDTLADLKGNSSSGIAKLQEAIANGNCNGTDSGATATALTNALIVDVTSAQNYLGDVADELECEQINMIWVSIMHDSVCTNMENGVTWLWGNQAISSFFLVWMACVSLIYRMRAHRDAEEEGLDQQFDPFVGGGVEARAYGTSPRY